MINTKLKNKRLIYFQNYLSKVQFNHSLNHSNEDKKSSQLSISNQKINQLSHTESKLDNHIFITFQGSPVATDLNKILGIKDSACNKYNNKKVKFVGKKINHIMKKHVNKSKKMLLEIEESHKSKSIGLKDEISIAINTITNLKKPQKKEIITKLLSRKKLANIRGNAKDILFQNRMASSSMVKGTNFLIDFPKASGQLKLNPNISKETSPKLSHFRINENAESKITEINNPENLNFNISGFQYSNKYFFHEEELMNEKIYQGKK